MRILRFRKFTAYTVIMMMISGIFPTTVWGDETITWQFQNSSDILEKTDLTRTTYTCDPVLEKCSVNLTFSDIRPSPKNHHTCTIDFGFSQEIRVNNDCNPNQVEVPVGNWPVTVIVTNTDTGSEISRVTPFTIIRAEKEVIDGGDAGGEEFVRLDLSGLAIGIDSGLDDSFICKTNTCQTNFHIDVPETALCHWDFGTGTYSAGNTDKCDPGYVTFSSDTSISVTVTDPHFLDNIFSQTVQIKRLPLDEGSGGDDGENPDPDSVRTPMNFEAVQIIVDSGLDSNNFCTGDACQVNFSLSPIPPSDALCHWDFGADATTSAANLTLCNPGYVRFPADATVTLTITDPYFPDNILVRTLQVKRQNIVIPPVDGGGSEGNNNNSTPLDLTTASIEIQSGLNDDFSCRTALCQTNLIAPVPDRTLCQWNFGTGVVENEDSKTNCNPGYVNFSEDTSVTLTLSDPYFPENTRAITRSITKMVSTGGGASASLITTGQLVPKITLQGKFSRNRYFTDYGFECIAAKNHTCSINFTAEESIGATKYYWDFGVGNIYEGVNPPAQKFPIGKYEVILTVSNATEEKSARYLINVTEKQNTQTDIQPCLDCANYRGKLFITQALPNPPHTDTVEWVEIQNQGSEPITLDSCILSDDADEFELSGTLSPGQKLRLRQAFTGLTLGNSHDELQIICGDEDIDTFSWDFSIPSGYILRREILKADPILTTVERGIDGDTIEVQLDGKKTKVRLLGIDTPETVDPRKSVQPFGKEASEFTKRELEGKSVWLTFDQEPIDHYGRRLAYVWTCLGVFSPDDCILFNARIVKEGVGRMERRFAFRYYTDFDDYEKEAKKAKVGVWSDPEVAKEMNLLSAEDKEIFEQGLESDYFELQQELLEICTEDSDLPECQENNWKEITEGMTTLNASVNKSGKMKISGRTWPEYPVQIRVSQGGALVLLQDIQSDTSGDYLLEWYPKNTGEYLVQFDIQKNDESVQLQKNVVTEAISDHFMSDLEINIQLQGALSKNRWIDENGVFQCRSRESCSVNLTAESNRASDVSFLWHFPDGSAPDKKNPNAFKVGYGSFTIGLTAIDDITGEKLEKTFLISHSPIPKAARKPRIEKPRKFTLDLHDVPEDVGGGVVRESETPLQRLGMSLLSVLLCFLFVGSLFYRKNQ